MSLLFERYKREIFILIFLVVSVGAASVFITYKQLTSVMQETYLEKLSILQHVLRTQVQDYFKSNTVNIVTMSSNEETLRAMQSLSQSFSLVQSEYKDQLMMAVVEKEIKNYLSKVSHTVPFAKALRDMTEYVPKSENAKILQYLYIANNPFGTHDKNKLFASNAKLSYDISHNTYHQYFLDTLKTHAFYDIFLINMAGDVVYSSFKEHDFATNLQRGIYQNSPLSMAYKAALKIQKGSVVFEDFLPYEASYNKPAAFMATPLFKNGEKIGVIAIQLSVEKLDAMMTNNKLEDEIGLGKSGEVYLVGSDFLMRSNARSMQMMQNPLVDEFGTTIGVVSADCANTHRALAGEKAQNISLNYRGEEVLSSFAPIDILGHRWAILAEIQTQEAYKSINKPIQLIIGTSIGITLLFLTLLSYTFFRLILKPLKKQEQSLSDGITLKEKELDSSQAILDEYKKAVDISSIVSKTDSKGIITFVNDAFCEISGYSREELIGKPHNMVRHPDMPRETFKEIWDTLLQKRVWKGVIKNLKNDGGEYYVNSAIIPILNENSEVKEFISIRSDITKLTKFEKQILSQTTDKTTSLPNREKLKGDILNATDLPIKLAIIQIERFREVNDFYGYEIANILLVNITSILKTIISQEDAIVYKISEDEFAILESKEMPMSEFTKSMTNIIKYFDHNVVSVKENSFNISVTVGLATGENSKLLFNTEMSLRRAIESSQSLLAFENADDVKKQYSENIAMTTKIKNAIKNDNIIIFAQEIKTNSEDGKNKYECLVRLRDGDKIISPFFFLDIAKKARLYSTITKIVIEKSFNHFRDLNIEFSINLTIEDILNDEIVAFLKRKIKDYRIGHRVVIELVESEGIENFAHVDKFIRDVKELGCQIAIDDFGTGYSNFEYLMKLNADYIKIDGSLIKNVDTDVSSQVVVELIVDFAKRMNIKTIGEFVHSESVYQKVKSLGIDYSQGYYLGEPMELK